MKYSLYFFVLVGVVMLFSCDKDNIQPPEMENTELIQTVQEEDVVFNGEYLVFKTIEIFDSICKNLNEMDENEFLQWENNLGFKSAQTMKWEYQDALVNAQTLEEYNEIEAKYSKYFQLDENEVLKYKFYASALANVLTINGYVMIENSLYKFTDQNEIIAYDGSKERIEAALKNNLSINDDKMIAMIGKCDNSKSASTYVIQSGTKTEGKYRLIYSLERYVFTSVVNFDPYTGQLTYKNGYQLYLSLNSEEYSYILFQGKIWNTDRASYDITDQYLDWYELGNSSVGYTGDCDDYHYDKTRNTIKYGFISRTYITGSSSSYADFGLRQLNVTFKSNKISNKTININ